MASMPGMIIKIGADTREAVDALNRIDNRMGAFGSQLRTIGIAMAGAFSVTAVVDFAKEAINLASSLEQAEGAAQQLFGGPAAKMATDWSKTTATNLGLAKIEALEAQNALGAFALQAGLAGTDAVAFTQDMVQAAADMSAAFGGDVKTAVEALSSAFRGQGNPIERYGILITQAAVNAEAAALGFEKVAGSYNAQAKVLATTSLIEKQMAMLNITGQNAREADTFAGANMRVSAAFKDLQTALGEGLLNGMTDFGESANDTGKIIEDLIPDVIALGEVIGQDLNKAAVDAAETGSILSDTWQAWQYEARRADSVLIGLFQTIIKPNKDIKALADANRGVTKSFDYAQYAAYDYAAAVDDVAGASAAATGEIIASGNAALDAGRKALEAGKGWAGYWQAALQAEAAAREASSMSGTVAGALTEGFGKGPDPETIRRTRDFQAQIAKLNAAAKDLATTGGSSGAAARKMTADWDQLSKTLSAASDATITLTGKQLELTEKQSVLLASRVQTVSDKIATQQAAITTAMENLRAYDDYVKQVTSTVTGGLNPDDFVSEVDGTWIFDALGFEAAIKDKASITEAVAGIAGQIPEAWAQSILGLPTDKANAIISWFANNPATDATIVTEYNALTQKVTDVWGPQLADAYSGINRDATIAGIEQAKQTIEDEAEAFKKWVRKKLKTKIVVEVEYKEVNSPPAAAATGAVGQIQRYEALNGTAWRL